MGRSEATIEWVLHNSKEIFDNGRSKTFPKMFWKTATPRLFLVKFQNDSRQLIINGKKKKKKKNIPKDLVNAMMNFHIPTY